MTKLQFKASPGIAIIEEIQEEQTASVNYKSKKEGRIINGKVISMGPDTTGTAGEKVLGKDFAKEGDTVFFLHYFDEGGVDKGEIDGKVYFFIKWGDLRAKLI